MRETEDFRYLSIIHLPRHGENSYPSFLLTWVIYVAFMNHRLWLLCHVVHILSKYLGPLHLPGFENRMADLPFYYRWAPAQIAFKQSYTTLQYLIAVHVRVFFQNGDTIQSQLIFFSCKKSTVYMLCSSCLKFKIFQRNYLIFEKVRKKWMLMRFCNTQCSLHRKGLNTRSKKISK